MTVTNISIQIERVSEAYSVTGDPQDADEEIQHYLWWIESDGERQASGYDITLSGAVCSVTKALEELLGRLDK